MSITIGEAASKFIREYAAATTGYTGPDDVEAVREHDAMLIIADLPGDVYVAALFDDAAMPTETAQEIFLNLARLARQTGDNPEALAKWRHCLTAPSGAVH